MTAEWMPINPYRTPSYHPFLNIAEAEFDRGSVDTAKTLLEYLLNSTPDNYDMRPLLKSMLKQLEAK
jgi:hypothetical protein